MRTAVVMDSDAVAVTGVDDLDKHLDELNGDPSLPLQAKLFDNVELQLTDANTPPLIPLLLPKITNLLKQYQQDPAILCSLAIKLLGPLNFTQILSLASEDAIIQALRSPAPSANILAMTVLEKAARSPSEAAILAMMKNVVTNFIVQWLSAPQVEVGEKGSRVLGDLLDVDCDTRPQEGLSLHGMEIAVRKPPGQGLMWRRILQDRDIYGLMLSLLCAGPHQKADDGLSDQQLTIAQGRVLRVLPRLAALNLAAVSRTDFPELNQRFLQVDGNFGVLQFAALHMVDNEDGLMHLNLVDFFETLISIQRVTPFSSFKMQTLRDLLRRAGANDNDLRTAILSLPQRTIPEESDDLKRFIKELTS